jgi:Transcriptional regulator/sugar kinase
MPNYLAKIGADIVPEETTAEEIFDLFDNDSIDEKYFNRLVDLNARGISTLIDLYAPELITFSGSVAVNNPEFMQKSFEKAGEMSINPKPQMRISDLENNLGLYGALALAQKKLNKK